MESMKITNIEMDGTEAGMRVFSTVALLCPVCTVLVTPRVEHLCGDRAPKVPKKKATSKRGRGAAIKPHPRA